jgi:hypothetical protein
MCFDWIYIIVNRWIYTIFNRWIYFWNDSKDTRFKSHQLIASAKTEALHQFLVKKYSIILEDYVNTDGIKDTISGRDINSVCAKRMNFYDCFTQDQRFELILREVELLKYKLQQKDKEKPPNRIHYMNNGYRLVPASFP